MQSEKASSASLKKASSSLFMEKDEISDKKKEKKFQINFISIIQTIEQVRNMYMNNDSRNLKSFVNMTTAKLQTQLRSQQKEISKNLEEINKAVYFSGIHEHELLSTDQSSTIFERCCQTMAEIATNFSSKSSNNRHRITLKRSIQRIFQRLSSLMIQGIALQHASKGQSISPFIDTASKSLFYGVPFKEKLRPITENTKYNQSFLREAQFSLHLPVSGIKLPVGFFLIFNILQHQLVKAFQNQGHHQGPKNPTTITTNNLQKSLQQIFNQISFFCRRFLIQKQSNSKSAQMFFIQTICESLGCYQFPIIHYFACEIVNILQENFLNSYKKLSEAQYDACEMLNKSCFNFKILQMLSNAFHRNCKNSFEPFKMVVQKEYLEIQQKGIRKRSNVQQKQKQYEQEQDQEFQEFCIYCGETTTNDDVDDYDSDDNLLRMYSQYKIINVGNQNYQKLQIAICKNCCIDFEQSNYSQQQQNKVNNQKNQKNQKNHKNHSSTTTTTTTKKDWKQYYFQKYHEQLIFSFCLSGFWRQQLDKSNLKMYKQSHLAMLAFMNGCNKIYKVHKVQQKINGQKQYIFSLPSSVFLKCIKGFAYKKLLNNKTYKENEEYERKNIVAKHFKSSLSELQCKVYKIVLALLNVKDPQLRALWFESVDRLVSQFRYNLKIQAVQSIFTNTDDNASKKPSGQSQIQQILIKIINTAKLRIHDENQRIKINALQFLFKIQQSYVSLSLKYKIFSYVITSWTSWTNTTTTINNTSFISFGIALLKQTQKIQISPKDSQKQLMIKKNIFSQIVQIIFYLMQRSAFHSQTIIQKNSSSLNNFNNNFNNFFNNLLIINQLSNLLKKLKYVLQLLCIIQNQKINIKNVQLRSKCKKLERKITPNEKYNSLIMSYLKKFKFTKDTIQCLFIDSELFQELLGLLSQQQREQNIQQNITNNVLFIFQQICMSVFDHPVGKIQKRFNNSNNNCNNKNEINKNVQKINKQQLNIQHTHGNDLELNLNRLIRTLILSKRQYNSLTKWNLLSMLLEKNIMLSYESEQFTQSPTKIKQLVLNIEVRKQIDQTLNQIEEQIKDSKLQNIETFLKVYVLLCLTVGNLERIQSFINAYKNMLLYMHKKWVAQFLPVQQYTKRDERDEKDSSKRRQSTTVFLVKTLKILTVAVAQEEKFAKIKRVTIDQYSELKIKRMRQQNKIFQSLSLQSLKKFDYQPGNNFLISFEKVRQLIQLLALTSFSKEKIENAALMLAQSIKSLKTLLDIHPDMFGIARSNINQLLKYADPAFNFGPVLQCLLDMILSIISTGKTYLMTMVVDGFKLLKNQIENPPMKPNILEQGRLEVESNQQENHTIKNYHNNFVKGIVQEKFYMVISQLLYQDVISLHDVRSSLFYGLMVLNPRINTIVADIVKHFSLNLTDGLLLIDIKQSIQVCFNRLQSNGLLSKENSSSSTTITIQTNKQFSKNLRILNNINKEDIQPQPQPQNPQQLPKHPKAKANKPILPQQLKIYRMRQTFVKKLSSALRQIISSSTLSTSLSSSSLTATATTLTKSTKNINNIFTNYNKKSKLIMFYFQIITNLQQVDIFQYDELIFSFEKIIKQISYYVQRIKSKFVEEEQELELELEEQIPKQPKQPQPKQPQPQPKQYIKQINIQQYKQKMNLIVLYGQILFTFIKILNENKLKVVKRNHQQLINQRRFNIRNIYFQINKKVENGVSGIVKKIKLIPCYKSIKDQFESFVQNDQLFKNIETRIQKTYDFIETIEIMQQIIFKDRKARIVQNQQTSLSPLLNVSNNNQPQPQPKVKKYITTKKLKKKSKKYTTNYWLYQEDSQSDDESDNESDSQQQQQQYQKKSYFIQKHNKKYLKNKKIKKQEKQEDSQFSDVNTDVISESSQNRSTMSSKPIIKHQTTKQNILVCKSTGTGQQKKLNKKNRRNCFISSVPKVMSTRLSTIDESQEQAAGAAFVQNNLKQQRKSKRLLNKSKLKLQFPTFKDNDDNDDE